MRKKNMLSLIRKAVIGICAAVLIIFGFMAALYVTSGKRTDAMHTEDTGRGAGRKKSHEDEDRQVKKETAAAGKVQDGADPYAHYDLTGNIDRESREGAKAAAAGAFGEWLHAAACEKDAPTIMGRMNTGAVGDWGYKTDPEATAAEIIREWGNETMEVLYFGHYYGDDRYVARFCLAEQCEGAAEMEYDLENASIHEITLYFDDYGTIRSFLPFPEFAIRGYARQYGIQ